MNKSVSRRFFLGSALAFAAGSVLAEAPLTSLRPVARPDGRPVFSSVPTAEEYIAKARLSGDIGFAVIDMRSGLVRESVGGDMGLPPASVAKAVTALYALDALGGDHRFTTSILALGNIENGILTGDLVLAGGGDPTLTTDKLAQLASGLKASGLREVRGQFLVWGGFLSFERDIDDAQPDHVGYNPAVSGLNLNFNRVHFQWKKNGSAYQVSMDARSQKHRPDVSFARMVVENRNLPVYTYADRSGRDDWTVARGALGNGGARWLPVRKPEIYAGEVFQTFARSHGIVLKPPKVTDATPDGAVLAQVKSGSLTDILHGMLKYSTNLTAEVVGQAATRARLGKVGGIEASAQAMSAWARERYGLSDAMSFVDHSGLGDRSRMTPRDMVRMLRAARSEMPIRALMKPVTLVDGKGQALKSHAVKVNAKTGTLNFVSALAGYITAADGTEMAFAIFTADDSRRSRLSRNQRERPEGGREWNRRAKMLQQRLLQRWGKAYAREALLAQTQ